MKFADVISKVARYSIIYGPGRTVFKAYGRLRTRFLIPVSGVGRKRTVGVVGCGQFAFATIGYFLRGAPGGGVSACYDIDPEAAQSFAEFNGLRSSARTVEEVLDDPATKIVYVASNHASHAQYTISALERNLTVYCEKPIVVSFQQFAALKAAVAKTNGQIFAGYNRPFSRAVLCLRKALLRPQGPMTLNCFISGHVLGENHWYRDSLEGTRICGNVGHWLDLAVHMLSWGVLVDQWLISLHWGNDNARDEDLAVTLSSARGDLISIVLTARTEPFEGINETINFQQDNTICKIDDFRSIVIWQGRKLFRRRFWPKDVGHRAAILQPFSGGTRDWREVELSTLLMLKIAEMVKRGDRQSDFCFSDEPA